MKPVVEEKKEPEGIKLFGDMQTANKPKLDEKLSLFGNFEPEVKPEIKPEPREEKPAVEPARNNSFASSSRLEIDDRDIPPFLRRNLNK